MNTEPPSHGEKPSLVIAAIPCFNEAAYIRGIVSHAFAYVDEVWVVDDGSKDGTAATARKAGAKVARHLLNAGPGRAVRSCFEIARERGAAVLVTLDGDLQHHPEDIPRLVKPILDGDADLVIGSRFLEDTTVMPTYRRLGIKFVTWLYNINSANKITDAQCCFRAYSARAFNEIEIRDGGFGFSIETLVQSRYKKHRIVEIPVEVEYHSDGSTINPMIHGTKVIFSVLRHRLSLLVNGSSVRRPK